MPEPRLPTIGEMGRRYTFPEREGISVDKLGRGDITSWARPTTSFKRPEVTGKVVYPSSPHKSLADYGMSTPASPPHDPSKVFMPADTKPDPRLDMSRALVIVGVQARLADHAIRTRIKRAKQVKQPKPVDLLADCPKTDPEVINKLKQGVEMEHDQPERYPEKDTHRSFKR